MIDRSRRRAAYLASACAVGALLVTACSSGGGFSSTSSSSDAPAGSSGAATSASGAASSASAPVKLTVMIASSGDAETNAVKAATAAWATKSGNTVQVIVASDINQQLGQAFAGGTPPDAFYVDASRIGDFAKAGNLYAYGDQVKDANFLPSLVQSFTYKNQFFCAPKDYSTLALIINSDMWKAAGLTDADIPKDWAGLESVAKKLTTGKTTGLVIGNDINRGGAFMKQAGGWVVSADGSKMTADSAGALAGMAEIKKMMADGSLKFNTDTTPAAGWGGEAFGKGIGAMTIEGNWIEGALKHDYPTLKAQVVELPAGPGGKGTLVFSQCWGIAAKSAHQPQAVDLVKSLTAVDQQMAFAKAFGVMPSTQEGAKQFSVAYPALAAFAAGGAYGQGPVNLAGFDPVMAAFNSKMATLGKGGDPAAMLSDLQKNGTAALAEG